MKALAAKPMSLRTRSFGTCFVLGAVAAATASCSSGDNWGPTAGPVEESPTATPLGRDEVAQVSQAVNSASWNTLGNTLTGTSGNGKVGATNTVTTDGPYGLELWVKPSGVAATRALLVDTASVPNLIGGYSSNSVTAGVYAGVISGGGGSLFGPNTVTDSGGFIGGGSANQAGDGAGTTDDAGAATVSGGIANQAKAELATVGGGVSNVVTGSRGAIGGGDSNQATGGYATVAGGRSNSASGSNSAVLGGESNTATGDHTTVGGGFTNAASGSYAFVGAGNTNAAAGQYTAVVAGSSNQANPDYSFVGGGYNNTVTITGLGSLQGTYSVVVGGLNNTATGTEYPFSNPVASFVGGGESNAASGTHSVVAGGRTNTASGRDATVAGGAGNTAGDAVASTVGGGSSNTASGSYSTVPGGNSNVASGNYSLAAGQHAKADRNGCFVWGDSSTSTDITCTTPDLATDKFVARASGGVWFYSNSALTAGVKLTAGANAWASVSDRNAKMDFVPVKAQEILARVAAMPMSTWSYKSESGVRHMGPMAQDFRAAFGLGTDDKSIVTVDADGVALAAIQGLNEKVAKLQADNAALQKRLDRIEAAHSYRAGLIPDSPWGLVALGLGLGSALMLRSRRESERS